MMKKYDLVIGGAGLYGATLAYFAKKKGLRPLVFEKDQIGGHCVGDSYSKYGIHVFHTSDRWLWDFVNSITPFRPVHYSPLAQNGDSMYSFPVNLLTLHQLGLENIQLREPEGRNFEEACIYSVGSIIYEKFFYHYTKKMWGIEPAKLPVSILKRIPVRKDYNTSYYNDVYVGIPEHGYTKFIYQLLDGVEVRFADFTHEHIKFDCMKVFTGSIDELYGYRFGALPYRGMRFEKCDPVDAMSINYTDDRPEVRKINYKYLWGSDKTIMETPSLYGQFYPVPWGKGLYEKYSGISTDIIFGGRLGQYRYLDMNKTIEEAISLSKRLSHYV